MMYATEMACKALGLAPVGNLHKAESCKCSMCARTIEAGDLSVLAKGFLPGSFFDFSAMVHSNWICGYCAALTRNNAAMKAVQACVITTEGLYSLSKDENRAWFWLEPPPAPFVASINNNTKVVFHYFWRSVVTLDARATFINVDGVAYQVNRPRMHEALRHAKYLIEADSRLGKKRHLMKSPFRVLFRDPSLNASTGNGLLQRSALALGEGDPQAAQALAYLGSLGPGELVALSSILKQKPQPPVRPSLITSLQQFTQKIAEKTSKDAEVEAVEQD